MGSVQHYPDKDDEEAEDQYEEIQYVSFEGYEIVKRDAVKCVAEKQERQEDV